VCSYYAVLGEIKIPYTTVGLEEAFKYGYIKRNPIAVVCYLLSIGEKR
jgi:hypothetical protein